MKDLKHLIYFENLLDSANNELVQQAKDETEVQQLTADVQAKIQQATEAFQKDLQETATKKFEEAQQTVVEELERQQEAKKKKGVEDDIRAHLRGGWLKIW